MSAYDEILSKQYHSVRFYYGEYTTKKVDYRIGDNVTQVEDEVEKFYDTWMSFHLIPSARPTFSLPKGNSKMVSIPGRSTPINMTEYLTGHVTYQNRTGSWTFYTDNDFVDSCGGWKAFDRNLRNSLHGRIFKIVLQDDPTFFYVGEVTIGQYNPGASYSTVTISYNVYPYKKAMIGTYDMWKFDELDFEDGMTQYLKDMLIDQYVQFNIIGSPERISPHICASKPFSIYKKENGSFVNYGTIPVGGETDYLDILGKPESIIPRFIITEGVNTIRIDPKNLGTGYVTIDYRRGLL